MAAIGVANGLCWVKMGQVDPCCLQVEVKVVFDPF